MFTTVFGMCRKRQLKRIGDTGNPLLETCTPTKVSGCLGTRSGCRRPNPENSLRLSMVRLATWNVRRKGGEGEKGKVLKR